MQREAQRDLGSNGKSKSRTSMQEEQQQELMQQHQTLGTTRGFGDMMEKTLVAQRNKNMTYAACACFRNKKFLFSDARGVLLFVRPIL